MRQNGYLMKRNDVQKFNRNVKKFFMVRIRDLQLQKLKGLVVDRIKNNKLLSFCKDRSNTNRNADKS
jgi:hypothetical protein